jgi:putative tricarboxylic transport membrane protein
MAIEQIYNIFWILFGIGICIQSIRHQLWSPVGPGSGFIPFLAGLFSGIMGVVLFFGELSKPKGAERKRETFWENPTGRNRVFCLLGSLCIMAILMSRLGFLLTSIFISILMIRVIEPKRTWIAVIITSFAVCFSLHFLFKSLMQINLPKGILGI